MSSLHPGAGPSRPGPSAPHHTPSTTTPDLMVTPPDRRNETSPLSFTCGASTATSLHVHTPTSPTRTSDHPGRAGRTTASPRAERASSPRRTTGRALTLVAGALTTATLLGACAAPPDPHADGELHVVTTTGILADFARHVAGDRAEVTQLIPDGADPHSHEVSLRAIRDVAHADLAFSNYLLLEQHSVIRALDANLPEGSPSVSIAEEASKQGATILPLVENRGLDSLWLGLRVAGTGAQYGADRSSEIDLSFTGVDGPGDASAFLTTAFGAPEVTFTSSDGFDPSDGWADDTETLPAAAHEHMSWAFSAPGVHRIHVRAQLRPSPGARPVPVPEGTLVLAVGVDPTEVERAEGRSVVEHGHADLSVDLDADRIELAVDDASVPEGAVGFAERGEAVADTPGLTALDLDDVVLAVPARTLTEVPGTPGHRFLGPPGAPIHLLPQAVLGKHVHGEIDPHLWHDVHNAAAYVRVIRDHLIAVDPEGAEVYRANALDYLAELDALDSEVAATIASIPAERRHLVTTNDSYAYLANAYGLDVAGVVAPHPGVEPSLADRRKLQATLTSLHVPAVFLEPQVSAVRSPLVSVAEEVGVEVCPLRGETLDAEAPTYVDMMRANARSLASCLGGGR